MKVLGAKRSPSAVLGSQRLSEDLLALSPGHSSPADCAQGIRSPGGKVGIQAEGCLFGPFLFFAISNCDKIMRLWFWLWGLRNVSWRPGAAERKREDTSLWVHRVRNRQEPSQDRTLRILRQGPHLWDKVLLTKPGCLCHTVVCSWWGRAPAGAGAQDLRSTLPRRSLWALLYQEK